jgi:predicted metal-dependent phosphoesterase TrpH
LGKAILHIHSTFSDGLATVDEILDLVEASSDVDIVGFTDHDDVRAYRQARRWVERHPSSRVRPLWGVELTIWGFKHLLVYCFDEPLPTQSFPKFLPLRVVVEQIKAVRGTIIVPHVDTFWVGVGRHRLARVAVKLGIDGVELLTPFQGSQRSVGNLNHWNKTHRLLAVGGSDAHHLEDLFKVIVEFPGRTVEELGRAFRDHTVVPSWGWNGNRVPISRQFRQHTRALVFHPAEQLNGWMRRVASERAGTRR